jgi:hypothetical protein
MKLDLKSAWVYPFRSDNRKNCLLWPGVVSVVASVAMMVLFGFWMAHFIMSVLIPAGSGGQSAVDPNAVTVDSFHQGNIFYACLMPVMGVTLAPVAGFIWHQIGRWQAQGEEAPALDWSGQWGVYWRDGLTGLFYLFLCGAPVMLVNILPALLLGGDAAHPEQTVQWIDFGNWLSWGVQVGMFFLQPFIVAAFFRCGSQRTLSNLLNLPASVAWVKGRYRAALWTNLLNVLISIGYSIATLVIGGLTCGLGFLLFTAPMYLTMYHLWGQVLLTPPAAQTVE